MTTMPQINDRMVEEFRRTGKRGASYSKARGSRVVSQSSRVVQQAAALRCYPYDLNDCPPGAITTCFDANGNSHQFQC